MKKANKAAAMRSALRRMILPLLCGRAFAPSATLCRVELD
jgi:hypothetical protein